MECILEGYNLTNCKKGEMQNLFSQLLSCKSSRVDENTFVNYRSFLYALSLPRFFERTTRHVFVKT